MKIYNIEDEENFSEYECNIHEENNNDNRNDE